MVKFTVDRIRSLMDNRANIRNVAVIAHVDHGKSTLTDTLIAAAGIIAQEDIGKRITDTHPEEQLKGITIKSTGISLYFETNQQSPYLINLIDSPGHVDFSSEVTAALRLTDGALVLVDCVEGAAVQTETVLRQALNERIKPVLAINKLDRAFLELQLDSEQMYQNFCNAIYAVNAVIAANADDQLGDVTVYPERGTVAFTAGKQGWGFNLQKFARMYAKKFNINEDKLVQKLWGDNYFDPETKKWIESSLSPSGKPLKRGFCQFIIEPIQRVFDACMKDRSLLNPLLTSLGLHLSEEEQSLMGKDLLKCVMQKWLPASEALLEMVTQHLPSPVTAQRYRVENLYTGPMDDEAASSIRECNPDGPLVVFVSKMLPNKDRSRFLAFGRVFSGTVTKGQKVIIYGPNYVPGKKEDMYEGGTIQRVSIVMGKKIESMESVPCGNTVALVGIDNYIAKSCTVVDNSKAFPMTNMKFSVAPVMRVAVRTKDPKDLPKLVDAMKWLNKTDTLVQCLVENTGELVVGCVGELHLEITIKELQSFLNGIEIVVSPPIVMYHETITSQSKVCLAKSPNKFNRLYLQAEPISDELISNLETGLGKMDPKDRIRVLTEDFSWSPTEARNLWAFSSTNLIVDTTRGIQYMHESRDSIVAAFNWVAKEGVLAEEPLRGSRFNIVDAVLHSDAIHRGGGQLIPCARRAIYASQMTANPGVMEPVYLVEINCPVTAMGGVYSTLSQKRGTVVETMQKANMVTVKGHLPVVECFGFAKILRENTSGQAFMQCFFDHWKLVEGDAMEDKTRANDVVMAIRKRKGLPVQLPELSRYLDTL